MRIYCPEHKKGFFAPRQSPITCENRGHVLGELNFAAEPNSQIELQWQYCCNCEHFCPISPEGESLERCPACTRRTSMMHICDRCFTTSCESNTPAQTKNFTLTAEGLPQPSCPGCLRASSGEVREHACDELGASFTTALGACPICAERLDIGPTFPSLIAKYLRRTGAANKLPATYDYEAGLFVEIEDGEFVIVTDGVGSKEAALLPRLTSFSHSQQFFEIYQDYYHYAGDLKAGEIRINQPASVERTSDGWRFQSPGLLEIADEPRLAKGRKVTRGLEVESPSSVRGRPTVSVAASEQSKPREANAGAPKNAEPQTPAHESPTNVCGHCGSTVEARYPFCWHCGKPMKEEAQTADGGARPRSSARRFIIDVDDPSTAPSRRQLGGRARR